MSSTSEKGLAKMLGNFNSLISACIGYGAKYAPTRKLLLVPQLQALHASAKNQLTLVHNAAGADTNAVNARQLVFEPLKDRANQVVYSLASSEADAKIVLDAKTINRKIQGTRLPKPKKTADPQATEDPATISTSQQSFDSVLDNFDKLTQLVATQPSYTPNEPELALAGLSTFIAAMQASNQAVINSTTAASNARISRNSVLFAEPDGLVPIANAVKTYLRSIFKVSSPEYKQVSKLQFRKATK
jgi:hypothetical protein